MLTNNQNMYKKQIIIENNIKNKVNNKQIF